MLDDTTPSTPESGDSQTVNQTTDQPVDQPAKKAAAKKTAAKKTTTAKAPAKKTAAKKTAAAPAEAAEAPAKKTAARKTTAKKAPATKAAAVEAPAEAPAAASGSDESGSAPAVLFQAPAATTAEKTTAKKTAAKKSTAAKTTTAKATTEKATAAKKTAAKKTTAKPAEQADEAKDSRTDEPMPAEADATAGSSDGAESTDDEQGGEGGAPRRRRRRGGRRRRKPSDGSGNGDTGENGDDADDVEDEPAGAQKLAETDAEGDEEGGEAGTRRRRRRRRAGEEGEDADEAAPNTVTRVRQPRSPNDQITAVAGSTRLEAKKQRRREGREAGRRRAPIVSEAEFLARRESVDRVMVIRQKDDLTQIAVLEDKVLVEHYVARESQTSLIGNVYLGRVQNVLPSMEAAFIDIGKGRNAVLYAGEVNWSALGHKDGQPRKIESVLSSGQSILVQVTKDPIGHKGARLSSQVSLAGRFLVYVPDGTTSGISRKLPDTERNRLKNLLKEIVPDTAGVIVRTAAEGASEEELTRDVERLKARWEEIEKQTKSGNAPKLLYGEPDLTLKVVRDLFTEDFAKMVIEGDDAWDTVQQYVTQVAPDLESRLERYERNERGGDVFAAYRIDEQIAKGLDRKVWLPSGGSLVIDRTEAMTVVDVNTGKFTGSGGNLEETVTKNNLEAAEEIVRQLRLRDIGGIIVVDFIDMVLESNRDLVLRRLVECLGRDRTRHQVAEVTSLGLVQMTRKRIGTGLLEAFSETCEHCAGRGLMLHDMPVEARKPEEGRGSRRTRGGESDGANGSGNAGGGSRGKGGQRAAKAPQAVVPSPAVIAAHHPTPPAEEVVEPVEVPADEVVETPVEAPAEAPAEAPVETVVEAPAVEVPEAVEAEVEPAAPSEAPAEPAAPKVITRTRKAASRPAGSVAAAPVPIVVTQAEPTTVVPTAAEPPKVITRTRGKAATRPAGPSTTADHAESHPDLHVPIKKKGARKH